MIVEETAQLLVSVVALEKLELLDTTNFTELIVMEPDVVPVVTTTFDMSSLKELVE